MRRFSQYDLLLSEAANPLIPAVTIAIILITLGVAVAGPA
jgi:hypothetical protein